MKKVMILQWRKCSDRPSQSIECMLCYSDSTIEKGSYCHMPDFDGGGFFTSQREFDSRYAAAPQPLYWMPLPLPPAALRVGAVV